MGVERTEADRGEQHSAYTRREAAGGKGVRVRFPTGFSVLLVLTESFFGARYDPVGGRTEDAVLQVDGGLLAVGQGYPVQLEDVAVVRLHLVHLHGVPLSRDELRL